MASDLILIVDDERDLVSTLAYNLEREGYQTRCAYDGAGAIAAAIQKPLPSLILLDLMLPDFAGTDVCRDLRARPETAHIPIVMLTAKGDEIDRVVGFELGADDYVVKPFSVRELMLRLRAILRRSRAPTPAPAELVYGVLRLDPEGHQVWIGGEEITLTALEFKLLNLLMVRKGRVQTRKRLLEDVWGVSGDVTTRTVDSHVKRLRQKLGHVGDSIETLRGVGYRMALTPRVETV